jgi:hypothetical protein
MTTLHEIEMTINSHVDVCQVRYEGIEREFRGINARLKRIESRALTVGGTIIVLLLGVLGAMVKILLDVVAR